MSETVLTPHEAARAVAEASRYEDALRQHTEGITWIIWGIATPGIFMTYAFAGVLGGSGWWMALLWIPWVAMGIGGTVTLWRTAALAAPALQTQKDGAFWLRFLIFSAAISALFAVLRPNGPELPLVIVGAMWMGMGIVNVWSSTRRARFAAIFAGAPLFASGVGLSLLSAPIEVAGTVAFVVSGLSPFLVGLWHALRG